MTPICVSVRRAGGDSVVLFSDCPAAHGNWSNSVGTRLVEVIALLMWRPKGVFFPTLKQLENAGNVFFFFFFCIISTLPTQGQMAELRLLWAFDGANRGTFDAM